jgi:hypothetical protein
VFIDLKLLILTGAEASYYKYKRLLYSAGLKEEDFNIRLDLLLLIKVNGSQDIHTTPRFTAICVEHFYCELYFASWYG